MDNATIINLKSYHTAALNCLHNIDECTNLAHDCAKTNHIKEMNQVMGERVKWIEQYYFNMEALLKPLIKIDMLVLPVSENISQSSYENSLHEAHAAQILNLNS